jgi:adenylate kinase family enzyme
LTGRRIVVVGTSGSGKTTIARNIARKLGIKRIELDELHWGPNWTEEPDELFRQRVAKALQAEAWVVDGNYSVVRDIVWPRADTVVWLNYRLGVVMSRVVRRTFARILRREVLWHGNRESFRSAVMSRDSIILWALTTYGRNRHRYSQVPADPQYSHITFIELRSPREARRWLDSLHPPLQ